MTTLASPIVFISDIDTPLGHVLSRRLAKTSVIIPTRPPTVPDEELNEETQSNSPLPPLPEVPAPNYNVVGSIRDLPRDTDEVPEECQTHGHDRVGKSEETLDWMDNLNRSGRPGPHLASTFPVLLSDVFSILKASDPIMNQFESLLLLTYFNFTDGVDWKLIFVLVTL